MTASHCAKCGWFRGHHQGCDNSKPLQKSEPATLIIVRITAPGTHWDDESTKEYGFTDWAAAEDFADAIFDGMDTAEARETMVEVFDRQPDGTTLTNVRY